MSQRRISLKERIERNSIPEPNTGCWLWTGKMDAYGYGQMHDRPVYLKAHRVAYTEFIGPIPEGMHVCHKCDMPLCVNPRHLWLGTASQNHMDRAMKGRSARGERVGSAKLNAAKITAIRSANGTIYELAAAFGISPQTISKVKRRELWRHIP